MTVGSSTAERLSTEQTDRSTVATDSTSARGFPSYYFTFHFTSFFVDDSFWSSNLSDRPTI